MEATKQLELALMFASDLAKQLITVASGILVLTVTLADKFRNPETPHADRWLITAWALLVVSILGGFWALMALTGLLAPVDGSRLSAIGVGARVAAAAQIITFALGIIAFMLYGLMALERGIGADA